MCWSAPSGANGQVIGNSICFVNIAIQIYEAEEIFCLILPPRWLSIYILYSSIKLICSRSSFPHINIPLVQFFVV